MKKLLAVLLAAMLLCVAGCVAYGEGDLGPSQQDVIPGNPIVNELSDDSGNEGEPDRSYTVGGKAMGIVAANRPVKEGFTIINQAAYDADYEVGETLAYLEGTELIGVSKDGNEWGFVKPGATAEWRGRTVSVFYQKKVEKEISFTVKQTGTVLVEGVIAYADPDTNSSQIGSLHRNVFVRIIEIQGGWGCILYGDGTAWIEMKYIG